MKPWALLILVLLFLAAPAAAVIYNSTFTPIMTSDTAPSGNSTLSSPAPWGSDAAWHAFDHNTGTIFAASSGTNPTWIQINLSASYVAANYTIWPRSGPTDTPTAFHLNASNDGITWVTLNSQTGISWSNNNPKSFPFSNANAYSRYRLVMTAWSNGGSADCAELYIYEGAPAAPTASFTSVQNPSTISETVQFTDTSTEIPTSWDWNFGDGSANVTTQNPTHIFTSQGSFPVHLIATNGLGSGSITNTQYVSQFNGTLKLYLPANSTPIKDESFFARAITLWGSAASSSGWSKFGGGSLYLPSNGSSYVSAPTSTDFNLGVENFTISFWIFPYSNSTSGKWSVLSMGGKFNAYNPAVGIALDSGKLVVSAASGTGTGSQFYSKTSSTSIPCNTSTYISVSRKSGVFTVHINGINETGMAAYYADSIRDMPGNLTIGTEDGQGVYLNGFVDEFRLYKGLALNGSIVPTTENFVPTTPTASFTASNISGLQPVIVHFTDTSTGGTPTAWGWNATCLENSTTLQFSTEQDPTQVFDAGHWLISLLASNAYGQDFSDQVTWINVSSAITPVSKFAANKTVILFPGIVGFTDISDNAPTVWNWSFGDGSYSDLQNATHQYKHRGRFNVTLNASNIAGSSVNSTTLVWVFGG